MTSHASHTGHAPHLDLMPVGTNGVAEHATHVAVNNGDWFDPATWSDGEVPGDGALVHIPAGVSVSYEGESDASLFIIRVDGALDFHADNGTSTKMVVDTIVTSSGSALNVNAMHDGAGTVDIVFAEGTPDPAHAAHYKDSSDGDGVLGRSSWDPDQLSLGLVASGDVNIKGQTVDGNMQLAEGPAAGATTLVFSVADGEDPGWAAGQKIVVGGSSYVGHDRDGDFQTEDEVRTISDVAIVDGQMVVTLDQPLAFDHIGPNDHETGAEITGFVGNLSRNVTFSSAVADADGDGLADRGTSHGDAIGPDDHAMTERGHVMFMHNDDVSVMNSSFFGLGRTDKSEAVDDFKTGGPTGSNRLHLDRGEKGEFDPDLDIVLETPDHLVENQRGRYPLHIHQAGIGGDHDGHGGHDDHHDHDGHGDHASHGVIGPCPETGSSICMCGDQDGDGIDDCHDEDYFEGAYLAGNVVWGSPGWGYVHHSSKALLEGNLAYDVSGSSFVAESGDEVGRWEDNLAIGSYGDGKIGKTEDSDEFNDDDGSEGVGFYLRARAIDVVDNAAHSSARAGFYYHNNGVDFQDTVASELGDLADIAHGLETIHTEDVPIRIFEGNAVVAAKEALRIATDPLDSVRKFNDGWSHLKDLTATAIDEAGVSITYSSKYIFENFQIYGTESKVTDAAQQANAGFYFKASVADITIVDSHVESFDHALTNWSQIGNRQEYRRGYWDPKSPSKFHPTEKYDGMGAVEGIDNPAHNLWNTNIVNLSYSDISGRAIRSPSMRVETEPGVKLSMTGTKIHDEDIAPRDGGIDVELLGDSRDGGLVALWREGIANNPDQKAMLQKYIPLAYQDAVYLSQVHYSNGAEIKRAHYQDAAEGINADIWSGTALEFAKEDSLGRHVFLYGDFSPVRPSQVDRSATTNEKILFTKDMIDGVLASEGFYRLGGVSDVKFVVMKMVFTDRLTGEWESKEFLVALDLKWKMPEGTINNGLLAETEDLVVAPKYLVFSNGKKVAGRDAIVVEGYGDTSGSNVQVGVLISDGDDELMLGSGSDIVDAAGGNDIVRGLASSDRIEGGDGHDALFGGGGSDVLIGDDGDDILDGRNQNDRLYGGGGNDQLQGGRGADSLHGGAGDDNVLAGRGADRVDGGLGNDVIDGGRGADVLNGGAGHDQVVGGFGGDVLAGADGDDVLAGNGGKDTLFGGDGADLMNGGDRGDEMFGGAGIDVMLGERGADTLFGDDGDDMLNGGRGRDRLEGGDGDDMLLGEYARDNLFGGLGDDDLFGGGGRDTLFGGNGEDQLFGEGNRDNLFGGNGDDLLSGGGNRDRLFGGNGADRLSGDTGRDSLFGGAGDDVLSGGRAKDVLTGGQGADVFSFEQTDGRDVITDFEDGVDAIEFLIESFGFDDLKIEQNRDDTLITHENGAVRLLDTDATVIDIADFQFLSNG